MEQSFGHRLAALRAERGWTQEELADASGLNRPRISLLENDAVGKPQVGTLLKLAKALSVPVERLDPMMLADGKVKKTQPADPSPLKIVGESTMVVQLQSENKELREQVRDLREQIKFLQDLMRSGGDFSKLAKTGSFSLEYQEAAEQEVVMKIAA